MGKLGYWGENARVGPGILCLRPASLGCCPASSEIQNKGPVHELEVTPLPASPEGSY